MDDLISRQAAIGIVEFECGEWRGLANTIVKAIEQLPSVQPEPPEECERCMMEHTDEMEKLEAELAMAQPTIQPDNGLQKLADEIASFKRCVKSENSDYLTGYLCALSAVEGMIADMREVTT